MNIGLVDVDGHNFPNFALMRISAYHKAQGDNVEWAMPLFGNYDRVYQSKISRSLPTRPTLTADVKSFAVAPAMMSVPNSIHRWNV